MGGAGSAIAGHPKARRAIIKSRPVEVTGTIKRQAYEHGESSVIGHQFAHGPNSLDETARSKGQTVDIILRRQRKPSVELSMRMSTCAYLKDH